MLTMQEKPGLSGLLGSSYFSFPIKGAYQCPNSTAGRQYSQGVECPGLNHSNNDNQSANMASQ